MEDYKYTDTLWFRDESKELDLQRTEVKDLLTIAFKLVKKMLQIPK